MAKWGVFDGVGEHLYIGSRTVFSGPFAGAAAHISVNFNCLPQYSGSRGNQSRRIPRGSTTLVFWEFAPIVESTEALVPEGRSLGGGSALSSNRRVSSPSPRSQQAEPDTPPQIPGEEKPLLLGLPPRRSGLGLVVEKFDPGLSPEVGHVLSLFKNWSGLKRLLEA